jgi:hypothetical protein
VKLEKFDPLAYSTKTFDRITQWFLKILLFLIQYLSQLKVRSVKKVLIYIIRTSLTIIG